MGGERHFQNQRDVSVSELKPGNVLGESISTCALTKGHVLSLMDINKIIRHNIQKASIFIHADGADKPGTDFYRKGLKDEISKKDLTPSEKVSSITDNILGGRLSDVVVMKKDWIRGENYSGKVGEKQQKQRDKFNKTLKKGSIQFIDEAMKVINDYSVSCLDLEGIESLKPMDPYDLARKMESYEKNAETFLNAVINNQVVYSSFVEDIVTDLLSDIGYKLSVGLLARVFQEDCGKKDYLSRHSLHVAIIALITAIEMTKMVHGKTEVLKDTDLDTFLKLSKKFFSLDDLINIGISAFLHDIGLKKNIPDMTSEFKFNISNQALSDLHTSEGFHLSKRLNVDFEVQNAVYQHNERFDGSGNPNGTLPRLFSKYSAVLMFAEHFIESTTMNPFVEKPQNPRVFLLNLLNKERSKFDGDVIYSFIRAASMYPVGSWVFLKDEKIGLVAEVNKAALEKPVVIVFLDKKLERVQPYKLNLNEDSNAIISPVNFSSIRDSFDDPVKDIWPYLSEANDSAKENV